MSTAPNGFAAVGDPTRRKMLDLLRGSELPAGDLVRSFPGTSQPGISRHLRVLRESGLVKVRKDKQRWIYSLRAQGFAELDAWIGRYRDFWPAQLDALSRHLDSQAQSPPKKPTQKATS